MTYDTSQIQAAQARAGLTMQELARKAGLSQSTVRAAVKGTKTVKASTLGKLANALGVDVGTFFISPVNLKGGDVSARAPRQLKFLRRKRAVPVVPRAEILQRLDAVIGVLLNASGELQLVGGLLDDTTPDDTDTDNNELDAEEDEN